jgi:hypothetical protein
MTDVLTFIHKRIIGFKPIKYTPFWWWYRLICHTDYRLDDRHLIQEFWSSLNQGWEHEQYILKFEEYWGKGSYPPERIIISETDYDHLRERLLEPPDPEVQERIKQIMNKVAPWEE